VLSAKCCVLSGDRGLSTQHSALRTQHPLSTQSSVLITLPAACYTHCTMQVILQGSLRHFPPAELLRFLGGGKQAGTLDLQSADGVRTRLFFRDGALVWGEAASQTAGRGAQVAGSAAPGDLSPANSAMAPDLIAIVASALGADANFVFVDTVVLPEGVNAQPNDVNALIAVA